MVKMRSNPKKSFPGGFFLFIAAAIFIIIGVQTLTSSASGKVSFSHQAEHLTNLGLIVPEENKKIAQNDNLVTFSGRFRETRSDESYDKYRYLELLNENHHLKGSQALLASDIGLLEKNVSDSADLYLHLSGQTIPRAGFVVVGPLYDSPERNSAIILHSLTDREVVSLPFVERSLGLAQSSQTIEAIGTCGKELRDLLALLRSPALGVGSESLKQELKQLDQLLSQANDYSPELQLRTYRNSLNQLSALIGNLGRETDGVRLSSLRSVRNYVEEVQEYNEVAHALESNAVFLDKARAKVVNQIWFFNNQELSTRALEKQDSEIFSHWFAQASEEWAQFDDNKGLNYRAPDQPRNTVLEKKFKSQEPSPNYFSYILTILPVMLVILFLYFIFSRQMKGVGSSAMNFGKSPARLMTKETNKVTFKDVAGAEEAKEELAEIVDFLRDPQKFTALGARIPKGVLLVGPPGTGKTLVAKAVAGEADRPFFSISGSDFVEMFVGVGASRIRDMFDTAKKSAPCIIFMDEIDAVGRHRGAGIGGGHDEREQTLNQLLVEMDGFDPREGVILVAATNRPDVLDPALLRPGRFDRQVIIPSPDLNGREDILKVHAKGVKLAENVNLSVLARRTPGFVGADLANLVNEGALLAARRNKTAVDMEDFEEAIERVMAGPERKSRVISDQEKSVVAYHESGHALVAKLIPGTDPVHKVSIIPRGPALGYTLQLPLEDRYLIRKDEILNRITVLLGGRTAEMLIFKESTSGAQDDFQKATAMAQKMVTELGMSDAVGTIAYRKKESEIFLGRDIMSHQKEYSEKTAELIDAEVKRIITECGDKAKKLLADNFDKLKTLAEKLVEKEVLEGEEVNELLGFAKPKQEPRADSPAPESPKARPLINPTASGGPIPQPAT